MFVHSLGSGRSSIWRRLWESEGSSDPLSETWSSYKWLALRWGECPARTRSRRRAKTVNNFCPGQSKAKLGNWCPDKIKISSCFSKWGRARESCTFRGVKQSRVTAAFMDQGVFSWGSFKAKQRQTEAGNYRRLPNFRLSDASDYHWRISIEVGKQF